MPIADADGDPRVDATDFDPDPQDTAEGQTRTDRESGSPGGSDITAGEEVGTTAEFFATSGGDLQVTNTSSINTTGAGQATNPDECPGPECDTESRARVQGGPNLSVEGGQDSEFARAREQAEARAQGREEGSDDASAVEAANRAERNLPLGLIGLLVGLFGLLWGILGGDR